MKENISINQRIKGFFKSLTKFEITWLLASSLLLLGVEIYTQDSLIGIICTVAGMLSVVLVAKGSIYNYFFGIINTVLYAFIAYQVGYGGDFVTFAFYYIPLQFVGIYMWRKNINTTTGELNKTKRMSWLMRILSFIIIIPVGTYITMLLLPIITDLFGMPINQLPFIDAFTTFTGIFAGILMVRQYAEQWWIWVLVNLGSVIMWATMIGQDASAPAMLIMWTAYLINAIYGLITWTKHEEKI